jgi:acylphosphatase
MTERLHFRVTGRVQGVFFRVFTRGTAEGLGLTGWVLNASDGSVEGEAFGESEVLDRFVQRLREGTQHSRVDEVQQVERTPSKAAPHTFDILY